MGKVQPVVDPCLMKTTILLLVSDPIACSVLEETLEREGYSSWPPGVWVRQWTD